MRRPPGSLPSRAPRDDFNLIRLLGYCLIVFMFVKFAAASLNEVRSKVEVLNNQHAPPLKKYHKFKYLDPLIEAASSSSIGRELFSKNVLAKASSARFASNLGAKLGQRDNDRRLHTEKLSKNIESGSFKSFDPNTVTTPPPTLASTTIHFDDDGDEQLNLNELGADETPTLTTENLLLVLDKRNWTQQELDLLPKNNTLNLSSFFGDDNNSNGLQTNHVANFNDDKAVKYKPQVYTTLESQSSLQDAKKANNSTKHPLNEQLNSIDFETQTNLLPSETPESSSFPQYDGLKLTNRSFPGNNDEGGTNEWAQKNLDPQTADKLDSNQIKLQSGPPIGNYLAAKNSAEQETIKKRRLSESNDFDDQEENVGQIFPTSIKQRVYIKQKHSPIQMILVPKETANLNRTDSSSSEWSLSKKKPELEFAPALPRFASASSTGIRVIADGSSRPLYINSRGLIMAKKVPNVYNVSSTHQKEHSLSPIVLSESSSNKQKWPMKNNTLLANDIMFNERPTFLKKPISLSGTIWKQQQTQNKTNELYDSNRNKQASNELENGIKGQQILQDLALSSFRPTYDDRRANETDDRLNQTSFQHNPPYKQPVLLVESHNKRANQTTAQVTKVKHLNATTLMPPAFKPTKSSHFEQPLYSSSTTLADSGLFFSASTPAYEQNSSDLMAATDLISQQLNTFGQQQNSSKPTKIKLKLRNMLMSNIYKKPLAQLSTPAVPVQTPAPLLSSTVANNVASLLAQRLNFLAKPFNSQPANAVSTLNSLFGVRVNSPALHGKLKQRVNPFASGPSHASNINRRTTGVGSLLFSGFIYGLSVLPALMALTGINPLSDSSTGGSMVANRHGGAGEKKSAKTRRHKPTPAASASSSFAFLVPLISAVLDEDQAAEHEPMTSSQRLNSLYAPPPTILDSSSVLDTNELHPLIEELGSEHANTFKAQRLLQSSIPSASSSNPNWAQVEHSKTSASRDLRNENKRDSLWRASNFIRSNLSDFARPFDDRASHEHDDNNNGLGGAMKGSDNNLNAHTTAAAAATTTTINPLDFEATGPLVPLLSLPQTNKLSQSQIPLEQRRFPSTTATLDGDKRNTPMPSALAPYTQQAVFVDNHYSSSNSITVKPTNKRATKPFSNNIDNQLKQSLQLRQRQSSQHRQQQQQNQVANRRENELSQRNFLIVQPSYNQQQQQQQQHQALRHSTGTTRGKDLGSGGLEPFNALDEESTAPAYDQIEPQRQRREPAIVDKYDHRAPSITDSNSNYNFAPTRTFSKSATFKVGSQIESADQELANERTSFGANKPLLDHTMSYIPATISEYQTLSGLKSSNEQPLDDADDGQWKAIASPAANGNKAKVSLNKDRNIGSENKWNQLKGNSVKRALKPYGKKRKEAKSTTTTSAPKWQDDESELLLAHSMAMGTKILNEPIYDT